MVEGISVRRVSGKDLGRIKEIADARLRENYSPDLFRYFFEQHSRCFFVACDDSSVAGFLLAVPLDQATLRILMLAVDDGRSGKGVGSALMDKCMEFAKGRMMSSIVLEVGTDNKEAIDFYSNRGFKMTGILTGYYRDRTDAYVMKHYLPM